MNTDGDACGDFAEFTFGECDPSNAVFNISCGWHTAYGGYQTASNGKITLLRTTPRSGDEGLTVHILPEARDGTSSLSVDLLEITDAELKFHVSMTGQPGKHLRTVQVSTPSQGVIAEGQVLWMVASCEDDG
jgi:hypothetical protein